MQPRYTIWSYRYVEIHQQREMDLCLRIFQTLPKQFLQTNDDSVLHGSMYKDAGRWQTRGLDKGRLANEDGELTT